MQNLTGRVNEQLRPILPVRIRRRDGGWEELPLLLDTGFNGALMLDAQTILERDLRTDPDRNRLPLERALADDPHEKHYLRGQYLVPLDWEGETRRTWAKVRRDTGIPGSLGTALMDGRRLTLDARPGGILTLGPLGTGWTPEIPPEFREEFEKAPAHRLPWTWARIENGRGEFAPRCLAADTGYDGELRFSPGDAARLGLEPGHLRRELTGRGRMTSPAGYTLIIWQGEERRVEWRQGWESQPPLIGMKLLRGSRLVIDFGGAKPAAVIRPLERREEK